jgi:hypothetical protein
MLQWARAWLRRTAGELRSLAGAVATKQRHARDGHRRPDDRQRFWTEFRDGQRQATEKCLEGRAIVPRDT